MQRRTFLSAAGAATLGISIPQSLWAIPEAKKYVDTIGLQLWTVRNQMEEDFRKTLQAVADAGYKQVELMDVAKGSEISKVARDIGLQVTSSFMDWTIVGNPTDETASLQETVDTAKALGLKYLVFGYVGKGYRETVDHYKKLADTSNELGELCRHANIQLCYHNHSFEFEKIEGNTTGFDVFIDRFDHDLTKFELDVFWAQLGGWDPVQTMQRLKGRIAQLHLKDLRKGMATIYDEGAVPHEAFKELGKGIVDTKAVLEAAPSIGVEQCHVEQDQSPNPIESIGTSMKYLTS